MRIYPVLNLEQYTEQYPLKEIYPEEPVGPESETKWINITMECKI